MFDIVATDLTNQFEAAIVSSAGMWTSPQFSPSGMNRAANMIWRAGLSQARDAYNSINGEYDLYVADRDGSNAEKIFPPNGQPGIVSQSAIRLTTQDFTWSPDGRQIALIYQGNLWVIDVMTKVAHQLTFDGQSKFPVWAS